MDTSNFPGGSSLRVVLRLAVISFVVGIVLKALGINLQNFFDRIHILLANLYDFGFSQIQWIVEYLLLGALLVVPIWLIGRLVTASRR